MVFSEVSPRAGAGVHRALAPGRRAVLEPATEYCPRSVVVAATFGHAGTGAVLDRRHGTVQGDQVWALALVHPDSSEVEWWPSPKPSRPVARATRPVMSRLALRLMSSRRRWLRGAEIRAAGSHTSGSQPQQRPGPAFDGEDIAVAVATQAWNSRIIQRRLADTDLPARMSGRGHDEDGADLAVARMSPPSTLQPSRADAEARRSCDLSAIARPGNEHSDACSPQ